MSEEDRELLIALTTEWHLKAEMVRMYQFMNESTDGEVRLKHEIDRQLAATEERIAFGKLNRAADAITKRVVAAGVANKTHDDVGSGR